MRTECVISHHVCAAKLPGVPEIRSVTVQCPILWTKHNLSLIVKIKPKANKQSRIQPKIYFSGVIRPKDGLAPSEEDRLADGRMLRSTAKRLCGCEAKADVLLDIMERFDMLIPYKSNPKSSETRVQEYLVPCIMKRVPQGKVRQKEHNVPILFFKFAHRDFIEKEGEKEGLFLPNGLFHRIVSRCCRISKAWIKKPAWYDYAEFSTDDGIVFSLSMAYNSILLCAIRIDPSYKTEDRRQQLLSNLREDIQSLIDDVLHAVFPNLTCVHYLECISEGHEHRYNYAILLLFNISEGTRKDTK